MPVVLRYKGYKFFFFSNEGSPREAMHVHVRKGDATAKIWLKPDVAVAQCYGLKSKEISMLVNIVKSNYRFIERSWHEYFGF